MYRSTHIKLAYFRTYPWRARSWIGIGVDRNSILLYVGDEFPNAKYCSIGTQGDRHTQMYS